MMDVRTFTVLTLLEDNMNERVNNICVLTPTLSTNTFSEPDTYNFFVFLLVMAKIHCKQPSFGRLLSMH